MKKFFTLFSIILVLFFSSCHKEQNQSWKPGMPISKDKIIIGVLHITDPFSEDSGYAYAHQMGIEEMKQALRLGDKQVLYKVNIDDVDKLTIESAILDLLANGANIILATSWGYMDTCENLAAKNPSAVFAHATGHKYNATNFTNYFGRVYQARYLSGIVAGAQSKTGKVGFVAAWGRENSEVTGGLDAFAIGVEKVNPGARIYVKVTNSWFDPMGEASAAQALIASGCDVIAQHCDTANPQIEAEKASVWGIGYNSDMRVQAPAAVLTSVLWNWGAYYTALVQSVIDGSFTTEPWFGSLQDGIVELSELNKNINWDADTIRLLEGEKRRIESGAFDVFSGVLKTNTGNLIGRQGENLSDDLIRNGINWYYHTVSEL